MHDPRQRAAEATPEAEQTQWVQRRQLVQAIMDQLPAFLDRGADLGRGGCTLREILTAIEVTLDTLRARVATQAFADGPPEAFWPAMHRVLDQFAPQLGDLVCADLE